MRLIRDSYEKKATDEKTGLEIYLENVRSNLNFFIKLIPLKVQKVRGRLSITIWTYEMDG